MNVSDNYGETPWSMASGISPVIRYQGTVWETRKYCTIAIEIGCKVVSRDQMDDRSPPPPGQ